VVNYHLNAGKIQYIQSKCMYLFEYILLV